MNMETIEKVEMVVTKLVFVAELIKQIGYKTYMVQEGATNFRISKNGIEERLKYDLDEFEYEIDPIVGVYRFRDRNYGPCTKWIPCEGS